MNSPSILLFVFLSILIADGRCQTPFVVTDFGAVADGKTDCKTALADAWKKACQTPGGAVVVPAGKTFMVSGGEFAGPCNGATTFQIDGTLVASADPKLDDVEYWITFDRINSFKLIGEGAFNGNGAAAWSRCSSSSDCANRPTSLGFHRVDGGLIRGITSLDSKMFHFHIDNCQDVSVENVTIKAPASSPNTDGIHVSNSTSVHIVNSLIATGDDCVSLGDGSTDIMISHVTCGPGHGISIGSLGKYKNEQDVRNIIVSNCVLKNTDNGLRIKTWAPSESSTLVSNVTYSDVQLVNVTNPIIIDQYYCPHGQCNKNGESDVQIEGVKYINVRGSSATQTGVATQCSKVKPCKDVEFIGLDLTLNQQPTTASCSNFAGVFQQSIPSKCS